MALVDFCEKPLEFDSNERLSKVISKMYSEKRHEAFVYNGGNFLGIISAADIVARNIPDPENAKLGRMTAAIRKVKVFTPDSQQKDIVNAMLINNYRSVPVEINGELLSLNKMDLLKFVQQEEDLPKGKIAEDIMFFPDCASPADNISVAKSLLRQSHIYRMAVVNSQNKVEGVIDELDLLKAFVSKKRPTKGEVVAERIKDDVAISSRIIMQDSFISVSPLTELKYVVDAMVKKNNDTVVVAEDGKLLGIITPREILKLIGNEISGVYVRVSGIQDEDAFVQSVVDSEIRTTVRKIGRMVRIHYMTLDVKKEKVLGKLAAKKVNYIVNGKLISNKGLFVSKYDAWELRRATKGSLQILEKEVVRKIGKDRTKSRGFNAMPEE